MPISYRDFVPEMLNAGGFLRAAEYEPLERALRRANEWIERAGVEVLNVETVVLPNLDSPYEDGSEDPELHTSGDMASSWHQFIRIWYRNAQ